MIQLLKVLTICVLIGNALSYAPLIPEVFQATDEAQLSKLLATPKQLRSSYIQPSSDGKAYQRADLIFNTKIPSLNPLMTGAVKSVSCSSADNSITLILKNKSFLKMAGNWPDDNVMLLINHQWECFGKKSTQFFLASNKTVVSAEGHVTYLTKPCDVMNWSDKFSLDVTWVQPKKSEQNPKKKKRAPRRRNLLSSLKDDLSSVSDDQQTTIPLNLLFDEKTGASSSPNIPLIKIGQSIGSNITNLGESLVCKNCFIKGQATVKLHVEGETLPNPKINNATLTIDGNLDFHFDMAVNGKIGVTPKTPDFQIVEFPLTPLAVPNVFNVGPSLILAASAQVSTSVTGTVYTGGTISYPNFHMSVSLIDSKNPQFQHSGFDAQTKSIDPQVGVTTSAGIAGSLKPQLALSVDLMNGLLQAKTGFGLTATLGADVTVGSESGCKDSKTPKIRTFLDGGLGFFVQSFDFPVVTFPEQVIGSVCV